HVVDQDLRGRDQRAQFGRAVLALQVEHDGALVAVHAHEQRAHVLALGMLGAVALAVAARILDLDDVGAHIAQGLRRGRPEDELGEVEDAHPVERTLLVGHGTTSDVGIAWVRGDYGMATRAQAGWKPSISDDRVKAATGRGWMGWFVILNRIGATSMTHKDVA